MMRSKRRFVSLLTAATFVVLAATGILAFARPFSIRIVGLHALIGFVFIGLIAFHVINNQADLKRYLRSRTLWTTLGIAAGLTALFLWQPAPVRALLGLSRNLGPAIDRFEVAGDGMKYAYAPSPDYRLSLEVRGGPGFDAARPPRFAIWLENASHYHIKTLHPDTEGDDREALPYWDFKRRGWEQARREAEAAGRDLDIADALGVDAISAPTENSSFDPADYMLPRASDDSLPYRLLIEIDQADDDQASLVYAVDIDNADPRTFQVLELVGYPKREDDAEGDDESWALYYIDESFDSALELIDSALLTIERADTLPPPANPTP